MNPKEMANRLDDWRSGGSLTYTDVKEIQAFLRNLPTVPEGYEMTGEWRQAKDGEYFLNSDGSAGLSGVKITAYHFPILRKIEPQFKPGEIVAAGTSCRYIGRDGRRMRWNGELCNALDDIGWELATHDQLDDFVRGFYGTIAEHVKTEIREKYGGSEGEGE